MEIVLMDRTAIIEDCQIHIKMEDETDDSRNMRKDFL